MAELTRTKLEREEEEAATTTANQSARAASTSLTTVAYPGAVVRGAHIGSCTASARLRSRTAA